MTRSSQLLRSTAIFAVVSATALLVGCGNDLSASDASGGSTTTEGISTSETQSTTGKTTTSTASPQEQSVSRSKFKEEFVAAAIGEGSPFTEEQASCMGDKIYDEVGAERITELNDKLVDSGNIPRELIDPVAKAGPECAPAGDLMREELASSELTPEQADCIATALNDDPALNQQVWDAIAATAAGDDSKADELKGAIEQVAADCVDG
jgi:hypothetical protein